ncbi:amidohydrolase family protein [Solihabitans fulvus]|uniref:Amidohydrolase family protein n=1 Tax=Solihabitans fulvus TaxID=1892852 RepID=A0A5B2XGM1_9PSEU|nr:amidohydrolase family protein [Solihabitans fulvus]KAA2262396.1 amidohydrolase family protein [Solihabitans fulvus]
MTVDAHHHVWDLAARDQTWITGPDLAPLRRTFGVPDLAPLAAEAGITTTVLVQTVTVAEETPELLALAEESDLIGAVVGWTDLTAPDVADTLAALREAPGGRWLRGIRHQVQAEPDPEWLCRKDVRHGLAQVGRAGLVYELLTLPHQLPAALSTVQALPEVEFVLDHCSKPPVRTGELQPWASRLRALAALPNVTCKLSGLVTEADWTTWSIPDLRPYVEAVLTAFGPTRVMFGSDWPVCLLAATYPQVLEAAENLTKDLTKPERTAIFTTTATKTYRLHL